MQERRRDGQAEGLGGLEVDDQLKLRGLLDRKIGWLGALEEFVDLGRGAAAQVWKAGSVRHQPPVIDGFLQLVHGGQPGF